MPRRATPCPYKRAAALRRPDFRQTRAFYAGIVREFTNVGVAHFFENSVRGAELSIVALSLITSDEASDAMKALPSKFKTFLRFCRRNRAWLAMQIAAAKANGPERGP